MDINDLQNDMKKCFTSSPVLALRGKGRSPRGMQYTEVEFNTVRFIGRLVLSTNNILEAEPLTDADMVTNEDLIAVFKSTSSKAGGFKDIAHAIRATYREIEGLRLLTEGTELDWPKYDGMGNRAPRNASSLNVLFRKAIKGLVNETIRDGIFKPNNAYGKDDEAA